MAKLSYTTEQIPFPGKDPDEKFCFYYRQHWMRLMPRLLRMMSGSIVVLTIGYIAFFVVQIDASFPRRLILLFLIFLFLYFQLEFLAAFYRHFLYIIVITDKKVHRIKRTLITIDDHESIDLWVLQDINKSQRGIIQNLLGFGTLILSAQDSVLRLHFTPNIAERSEDIMHLRERARARMQAPMQQQMVAGVKK